MLKEMYLRRAIKEHGTYEAAVQRIAAHLNFLCDNPQGKTPYSPERAGQDLGVMIGHLNKTPDCPACNLGSGVQPVERDLLAALERFERSENRQALAGLSIRVCFDDANDFETIDDPLARYVRGLGMRMMAGVICRTKETARAHGTRPFMYH